MAVEPLGASGAGLPPNMHEVARLAGVSLATVSNTLNHPGKVKAGTRDRVQHAIDELGYTPNQNARTLRAGASSTIGLVLFDLVNSLFVDIARGAQRTARQRGFSLQLASSDNDPEQQDEHIDFFDRARVSGVILAPMYDASDAIARVRRHRRPAVVVNYALPEQTACTVLVDNEKAGRIAVEHLIATGARRIAFVGARWDLQPVALRWAGAQAAVAAAGDGITIERIDAIDLDPPGNRGAGAAVLEAHRARGIDGVLAVTDQLALDIVSALDGAGVAVPDVVRVMGCDHNSSAWGGNIPLSSVALDGEQMGADAVALLIEEVQQRPDHEHRTVLVEPSLVVRESTIGRPARHAD